MEIIEKKPDELKETKPNTEIVNQFGPDYEKQFEPVKKTKAPQRYEVTKKTVLWAVLTFVLYFLMFVLVSAMMAIFQKANKGKSNILSKVTTKEESFFRQIKQSKTNIGIYKISDVNKSKEEIIKMVSVFLMIMI